MRFSTTTLLLPLLTILSPVFANDYSDAVPTPSVILSTSTRTVVYVTTEIVTGTPPASPQNTTSTIKPSVGTISAYPTGSNGTSTGSPVVSPSIQPVGNAGAHVGVASALVGVLAMAVAGLALC